MARENFVKKGTDVATLFEAITAVVQAYGAVSRHRVELPIGHQPRTVLVR